MIKSELLKLIEPLGENDDVLETLKGVEGLSAPFDATKLTLDDYKSLLENNAEIKGYATSSMDSAISKAINSHDEKFMKEKFPKLLEEEMRKKSNEGKTPEQIAFEEMKSKYEAMEKQIQMKDLTNKYSKVLNEKGLPLELVDYILGDGNEETINGNIEKFSNMFSTSIDSKVNEKLKTNSYVPPKDGSGQMVSGVEQAFYAKNPSLAPQQ